MTYKRFLRICFPPAAAMSVFILAAAPRQDPKRPPDRLEKLFTERRYFELSAALATENAANPDLHFYRGVVANAFNRPKSSADDLTSYLQAVGATVPPVRLREALGALADDYVKMFAYAQAAEIRAKIVPLLENELGRADVAGFKSVIALWKALASAPPQTVDIPGDTEIQLTEAGEITATIGDGRIPLLPDTGSALSMIVRTGADRLGLTVLDVRVQVATATGKNVTARPCLVPELRLGGIVVRNAVFLVVPDEMLYFPEIKLQRSGIIGFPILAGLKELTFAHRRNLVVTSPPRLEGPPNFFLERADPVIPTEYEGRGLLFLLDTGAFQTQLFPPFFRLFSADIMKRGLFVPEVIEGVGTHAKTEAYIMSNMSFKVAGREVLFPRSIPVLPRPTSETSEVFHGSFALDLLDAVKELTLNYEAMRIALK